MKKRVTGIGGVFFKSQDPEKMKEWYNKHLGFNAGQYGGTFEWKQADQHTQNSGGAHLAKHFGKHVTSRM